MILVVLHTVERTAYDKWGKMIEEKGDVVVSHGVDCETGKTVILPCEPWRHFSHHCRYFEGEWYLK